MCQDSVGVFIRAGDMLLITLNSVFALVFLSFAREAARRGLPLIRAGWLAIRTQAAQPDHRQHSERRRLISEGGQFVIGGLLWLLAAAISAAAGLYFAVQAVRLWSG
jgi:hypothetical protein